MRSFLPVLALILSIPLCGAQDNEPKEIGSDSCIECHEESLDRTVIEDDLTHSVHEGFECLDCHSDMGTDPHDEKSEFSAGSDACRACHDEASEQYKVHGRAKQGPAEDIPQCMDCHGTHDILPSQARLSRTNPINLPLTCGECHEDINLTTAHDMLIDHPVEIYQSSVHGKATRGGIHVAATCNDCHSTGGTAHRIFSPGHPESSINHFEIPNTCGRCHDGIAQDFWEGIHGQLVARSETDAPVCTTCHGEHGIISPNDPKSPVSRARVAQDTCAPCHESAILNEKYGLPGGHLASFIDSYHGLKSKAGDTHVANCASCHGVHRILPSSDPSSTINQAALRETCGECHPGISDAMAATPIHGISGRGLHTKAAEVVEDVYFVAIVVIIGLMVIHWLLDLFRQIRTMIVSKPQVQRMRLHEVWQHAFVALTFTSLVLSGFALRFSGSWLTGLFFGWEGGCGIRGVVHRISAIAYILTVFWHFFYLVSCRRGREFFWDMKPTFRDFRQFWRTILFNIGARKNPPRFGRFSYVEKAEYWAIVWGTAVMVITGFLLWFDNWFIQFLPKGVLDVSLVVHYWEAWLATLAILVWHLYSTVFSPHVYPMNPSWLSGKMPEQMYRQEHPRHLDEAKRDGGAFIRKKIEALALEHADEEEEDPG